MLLLAGFLGVSPAVSAEKKATATPAAAEKSKAAPASEKKELLDINSASLDELKSLKGIGDAYAKKIVDNRPYKRKDELTRKKIIPQATYDGIKEQIVAHQAKSAATKAKK